MAKKILIRESVPSQHALLFTCDRQVLTTGGRLDRRDNAPDRVQELAACLDELAPVYNSLFHSAFVLLRKGVSEKEAKRALTARYGLKSRVINSALRQAKTELTARRALYQTQIEDKENKIVALKKQIRKMEADYKKLIASQNWVSPEKGAVIRRRKLKSAICRKKDRLHHQQQKLEKMKRNAEQGIPVCFGSKKLFHAQFHLEENGFASHEEWKKQWIQERTKTVFQIGSSDESHGNQICQFTSDGSDFGYFQMSLVDAKAGCKTVRQCSYFLPGKRTERLCQRSKGIVQICVCSFLQELEKRILVYKADD